MHFAMIQIIIQVTIFFWNNWNNLVSFTYFFIGKIDNSNDTIVELQNVHIPNSNVYEDSRIIYLKDIIIDNDENIYIYLLCPRNYSKSKFSIVFIQKGISCFNTKTLSIESHNNVNNLENCTRSMDINMPRYDTLFESFNEDYDIIKLYFLRWFENHCITRIVHKFFIPKDDLVIKYMNSTISLNDIKWIYDIDRGLNKIIINKMNLKMNDEIKNTYAKLINDIKKTLACEEYTCTNENENNFKILDDFLAGEFNQLSINHTLAFSFGSPFIDIGDNKLSSVGHAKFTVNDNVFKYDDNSTPVILRKKIYDFMDGMFGKTYVQHLGGFKGCLTGYHYFSYFILWNKIDNVFQISDFFLPIDLNDKYHFSLIFSIGICKLKISNWAGKDEYVMITSGTIIRAL